MRLAQRVDSFDFDLTSDRRIDVLKRHVEGEPLERFQLLMSGKRDPALFRGRVRIRRFGMRLTLAAPRKGQALIVEAASLFNRRGS